jgi:hypothetical protein
MCACGFDTISQSCSLKQATALVVHPLNVMEQRISYIFIYYIWHLYKGVAIFNAAGTNLQQKLLF